jgi:hypothetical protein
MSNHNTNALLKLLVPHMDPTTAARFAATSRRSHEMSSQRRSDFDLVRRLVRRRKAIIQHTRSPTTRRRTRLSTPLYENRMEAIRRAQRPQLAQGMKIRRLRQAAHRAHANYQQTPTNAAWNRFVRIHIKTGGRPNINRENARRVYN